MKWMVFTVLIFVYSVAVADSILVRVLPDNPKTGRNVTSEQSSTLPLLFQIEHMRSSDGFEFRVVVKKKEGTWIHDVQARLGEVQYFRDAGSHGWSIKSLSPLNATELTDTTAVYLVAIPDTVIGYASFLFERTYGEIPGADIYEIKLSEWVE